MKYTIKDFREHVAEQIEKDAKICDQLTDELDEPTERVFSEKFKGAIKTMNGSIVSEECAERIRAQGTEGGR